MRTYSPRPGDVSAKWHLIDADDVILGRLASQITTFLRGKYKPTFAPNFDSGNHVVVINTEKVVLIDNKWGEEMAYHHSGFPDGLKATSYGKLREQQPEKVIEGAVRGMMPHMTLGWNQLRKLKVYAGAEHPHAGQNPEIFELAQIAQ